MCIWCNSEYAARICTGTWKAKKHKAMAEEARRAWAQLKHTSGGRAWMRYVPRTETHYSRACQLAKAGKGGAYVYAEVV